MGLWGLLAMGLLSSCGKDESKSKEDYTETAFGMKMEMVYVKGGEFLMGATAEQESEAEEDEYPVRNISLSSYHIGKYEVTQAQWQAVMGTSLAAQRDSIEPEWDFVGEGDNYPMYYVSWEDASKFCQKLSEKTGKKYVLPTEAMWEYAARGGAHRTGTKYAGSDLVDEVAWYYNNSCDTLDVTDPNYGTHPVGRKKANALGLCDMSGNVWEWCSDLFGLYDENDTHNPQGSGWGASRALRGGAWDFEAVDCRVSNRINEDPAYADFFIGFRVAMIP